MAAQPFTALGPSFDCGRSRDGLATTICGDAGLRRLDLEFVQAYQALRHQLNEESRTALRQDAVTFHNYVHQACNVSRTGVPDATVLRQGVPCVAQVYRSKRADWVRWLNGDAMQEVNRDIQQHVALQARLIELGLLSTGGTLDGVYGPATRDAISRFQAQNGHPSTGFLTDATARLLRGERPAPSPVVAAPTIAAPAQPGLGQVSVITPPASAQRPEQVQPPHAVPAAPVPSPPEARREAAPAGLDTSTVLLLIALTAVVTAVLMLAVMRRWQEPATVEDEAEPTGQAACTPGIVYDTGATWPEKDTWSDKDLAKDEASPTKSWWKLVTVEE